MLMIWFIKFRKMKSVPYSMNTRGEVSLNTNDHPLISRLHNLKTQNK